MKKGSSKCISFAKWVVPQSWGTSNGTFITDTVSDIAISFVEYSASKKVCLQPDIVEYSPKDQAPMYDLIMGKQTMHDLRVVLDFQEKTIKIDKILLPIRNIANLQLKPSLEYPTMPWQALRRCCVPQRDGEGPGARLKPKSTT
jgi:hypothetical protein